MSLNKKRQMKSPVVKKINHRIRRFRKQEDKEQVPKDEQDSVLEEITDEEVKEEVEDLKSES